MSAKFAAMTQKQSRIVIRLSGGILQQFWFHLDQIGGMEKLQFIDSVPLKLIVTLDCFNLFN